MNFRLALIGIILCCWGCQNIEDATPAKRSTFIRLYEAAHNVYGVTAEPTEDGYIILGNETLANGNQNGMVILTDAQGERATADVILEGGPARSLKATGDGYYVIGDSIKLNLESSDVPVYDLVVNSARLFKLNFSGTIMNKIVIADRSDTINITDIFGGAVTINNEQDEVIVLGTFKNAGAATTQRPFVAALDPVTLDTIWVKTYDAIDRDYVNSRSVHMNDLGKIIWATALLKENQNFSRSYLGIPYVQENSTFENFSQFGEQTDQQLYSNDIQPAVPSAMGYGIVGTHASPAGTGGNMFFIKANQSGNVIESTVRYFDGEMSLADPAAVAEGQSRSEDTGDAIIATHDGGFVLAGSMLTTPERGNGGKDIFLVKVDSDGDMLWNKVIGGAGDETVSSIRETADGGLLICGSNNASGLSSIFIMKTDMNGDLNN